MKISISWETIAYGDILAADFINKGEKLSVIRFTQRGRKITTRWTALTLEKLFSELQLNLLALARITIQKKASYS